MQELIAAYWFESGDNEIYTYEEFKETLLNELTYYAELKPAKFLQYKSMINNTKNLEELAGVVHMMFDDDLIDINISEIRKVKVC